MTGRRRPSRAGSSDVGRRSPSPPSPRSPRTQKQGARAGFPLQRRYRRGRVQVRQTGGPPQAEEGASGRAPTIHVEESRLLALVVQRGRRIIKLHRTRTMREGSRAGGAADGLRPGERPAPVPPSPAVQRETPSAQSLRGATALPRERFDSGGRWAYSSNRSSLHFPRIGTEAGRDVRRGRGRPGNQTSTSWDRPTRSSKPEGHEGVLVAEGHDDGPEDRHSQDRGRRRPPAPDGTTQGTQLRRRHAPEKRR